MRARGARERRIAGDGVELAVWEDGDPHAPTVVLVHGYPDTHRVWSGVVPLLAAHFHVVAYDVRGAGASTRPVARRDYRMAKLEADLAAVIDAVSPDRPVHLVGHDWGAALAWGTAAARPDLVHTLTTVSVPHPAAFTRSLLSSDQALRSLYVLVFQPPGMVELLARTAPGTVSALLRTTGLSEAEARRFREEILDFGALPGALGWYRALPFSGAATPGPVRVPTTHVWSDGDVALARRGAELTVDHVRAPYRLRVLHGVSHWVPTQAPAELADAILDRVTTAPTRRRARS